jgi:hypothetical protein
LSYLSCEVCIGLVILIDIEVISSYVLAASNTSNASDTAISISSIARPIVRGNKDYLLADDATSINFVTIGALTDASIVKEHQRALTLETPGGFRW